MTEPAQQEKKEIAAALSAVLGRLKQVHALWGQASQSYFDPARFRLAVQNCITTARTVTFILQKHKAAVPDFDAWYEPIRKRLAADPVMRWAQSARNKIEKQGDLETESQVKAELVAAYAYHPKTDWLPEINATPEQIRASIPVHLLDAHVRQTGVLAIERRWIDSELPEWEILDALAHVYGQLAFVVIELHRQVGAPMPAAKPEMGEHLLRNLLEDGRTASMARPADERTIYVSVRNGALIDGMLLPRSEGPKVRAKARKRYGPGSHWGELKYADSFEKVAEVYFKEARHIMLRDGHHMPLVQLFRGPLPIDQISPVIRDRQQKYLFMRELANLIRRRGADGVLFISEAWIANRENVPTDGVAVDAAQRGEALVLWAANAAGETISFEAIVERKRINRHKVKALGPTVKEANARIVAFAPILEAWGRLADLRLDDDETWPEGY